MAWTGQRHCRRSGSSADQSAPRALRDGRGARDTLSLLKIFATWRVHCVLADEEPLRDRLIVEPGGDESQDFTLARGEAGGPLPRRQRSDAGVTRGGDERFLERARTGDLELGVQLGEQVDRALRFFR